MFELKKLRKKYDFKFFKNHPITITITKKNPESNGEYLI